jgi:bifunctional UDP-N-acetylglucosamine pyrophosphorylase/glucosamine-1-phosphate N-acetyltransferase
MENNVSIAILAAGLGTRMKSKTAKVLHRAGGRTLIEHVVRMALRIAAPERVAIVVGHQSDKVRAALDGLGVRFVEQTEQRGTGHALRMCRDTLEPDGGLVVALYGDGPLLRDETIRELIARHSSSDAAATLIATSLEDPTGYGRVIRNERGDVVAVIEEKACSPEQRLMREVNSGIYCFRSELLWPALAALRENPASGEIYLTDLVESYTMAGRRVAPMVLLDAEQLIGINTRLELAAVDRILRERKVRDLMLGGVTVEKPETVTIDADVEIGIDTIVEPFVQILGNTRIGSDCRVGACSIVRDSTIEDGVEISAFSIVGTSRVGAGSKVGPYARLREGNQLASGVHIGNFVELKKARLGTGTKAMHLAYLGDSSIGERVNVGAGTITCNYDGRAKHQTRIGDDVFVGSNSTLVAPIEIGDASYVAAGSVITEAVPVDTLALGRAHQTLKPGWPSKRRKGD